MVAIVFIGLGESYKTVRWHKVDDLPEYLKGSAHFEGHRRDINRELDKHAGYYIQKQGTKTAVEFLSINREEHWYTLYYSNLYCNYQVNRDGELPYNNLWTGYYNLKDPRHPEYIALAQQPEPVEEYLAGGLHHTTALQGPQSQLSPTHEVLLTIGQAAA